jgi:outer membrane protein assembly factor BamE (lipoprotein component of BamABCDE complex)
MKNLIFILIFIVISNCTLNKVVKHHGVHYLEKKHKTLQISTSNKNDILNLLGPPSTKSTFDNDVWIYIERKTTTSEIRTLGRKKILVNNVLILEIDNKGLLAKKNFLNTDDMNQLKISTNETNVIGRKNTFINSFLSSLRQKINDPLGKRKAK